jgi:virginiamycin B lyase
MLRVLAVIAALALGGCGQATALLTPAAPLPRDITPVDLAVAGDGGLWMTQEYGDVTRVAPDGAAKAFPMRDELFTADIAAGPDGTIWVSGDQHVFQYDAAGRQLRRFGIGQGIPRALAASGDAMWILYENSLLLRMDVAGAHREPIPDAPDEILGFNDMTGAPDGSVWFTETNYDDGNWIGRRAPDGRYSHSKLPRNLGAPGEIAAGPDGAAWFTGRHALGRVDANGLITRFRLPGAVPRDIVAGRDGAMWFTSDICLGRITGAGAVTTWPVPGAVHLNGLAEAADGRFWLADKSGNAIRTLDPSTTAPAPCGGSTLTRTSDATSATVSFEHRDRYDGVDYFTDIRISIARDGEDLLHEIVPKLQGNAPHSDSKSLIVRDLDGDGEPEVLLTLNWNGNGCCSWSRIYRYTGNTYVALQHFWGNGGAEPVVRDLDGDHAPELRSFDDRFSHKYVYRGTARPLQIWSYRKGRMRDVTRRFPDLVSRDAVKLWRQYRKNRALARGFLPAWMADQYLLGRKAFADRALADAAARGELKQRLNQGPESSAAYVRSVKRFLAANGY